MNSYRTGRKDFDRLKRGFDVRAWLDDVGVSYSTGGDNVSSGWIGMKCIYCPADHADHLGVNLRGRYFHCWLCGAGGDALQLVRDVEGLPFALAVERLERFQSVGAVEEPGHAPREYAGLLPARAVPLDVRALPVPVEQYLRRRRFDRGIIGEYGLMWCGADGEYPLRLIVPVRVGGELVSWLAADVTGRAGRKYLDCPKDRALVHNKAVVYGIDDVADASLIVVVEGVTDRWRVGRRRCVAMFWKDWTPEQLLMLNHGIRRDARVIVMLDADAHEYGRNLGEQLAQMHSGAVEIVLLPNGDPGGMSDNELEEVMRICESSSMRR
jgi:hypothetical protein